MAIKPVKKAKNIRVYEDGRLFLTNVLLAYPKTLIKPEKVMTNPNPTYTVTLLLDKTKHADAIELIKEHCKEKIAKHNLGKLTPDKMAFKDGENTTKEAYEPYYVITLSAKQDYPPKLRIDAEEQSRVEDEEALRELCVNGATADAVINFWPQDNDFGRRLNANVVSINFHSDKTPVKLDLGVAADDSDLYDDDDDDDDDNL